MDQEALPQQSIQTLLDATKHNQSLDEIKPLITDRAVVNGKNEFNTTPLLYAAQNGNLDVVNLLIDCGADVNVQNTHKWTLLMIAAYNGKLDVVRYCLIVVLKWMCEAILARQR